LFAIDFAVGWEGLFSSFFYEQNLLYGRELSLNKYFKVEGQLGLGSFSYNKTIFDERQNTVGYPM
jgi:hypothetical protein